VPQRLDAAIEVHLAHSVFRTGDMPVLREVAVKAAIYLGRARGVEVGSSAGVTRMVEGCGTHQRPLFGHQKFAKICSLHGQSRDGGFPFPGAKNGEPLSSMAVEMLIRK
jgi:hypothetical protein